MIGLEQIRAARAMLGLKQQELARKAGISTGTLNNIERGVQIDPKSSTLRAIQQALEAEGIVFTQGEQGEIGLHRKPAAPGNANETLLIIDDNPADRKLYKAWLGKTPDRAYAIIEAGNAKEGYDAFLQHDPACIILDFMMYGKDGFQLLVQMKRTHAAIPPIIFVTAMSDEFMKREMLALGVHCHLDKARITPDTLRGAVARALR